MTLLEVYEGTSKDLQITDEIYWEQGFRKVVSIAPCDACHLPCLRVDIVMPRDSRHPSNWVKRINYDPYSTILIKRPE
jgi:hypothetical protein